VIGSGGAPGSGGIVGTGGVVGTGGASGTGGSSTECESLSAQWVSAVAKAKRCNPSLPDDGNQCVYPVEPVIGCGCSTFVNDTTELNPIWNAWVAGNCVAFCLEIVCIPPASGTCLYDSGGTVGQGICADVRQGST
jgi:hypothetical protein